MNDDKNILGKIGCLAIVIAIIAGVISGLNKRAENHKEAEYKKTYTRVHLVTGGTKSVKNSSVVGSDTTFIGSDHVYINNTGKDLVEYFVKYTTNGYGSDRPIGIRIKPNQYFYWYDGENDRMFSTPPSSTSIVTHHGRKIEFVYLHFLDYASNVSNRVEVN